MQATEASLCRAGYTKFLGTAQQFRIYASGVRATGGTVVDLQWVTEDPLPAGVSGQRQLNRLDPAARRMPAISRFFAPHWIFCTVRLQHSGIPRHRFARPTSRGKPAGVYTGRVQISPFRRSDHTPTQPAVFRRFLTPTGNNSACAVNQIPARRKTNWECSGEPARYRCLLMGGIALTMSLQPQASAALPTAGRIGPSHRIGSFRWHRAERHHGPARPAGASSACTPRGQTMFGISRS